MLDILLIWYLVHPYQNFGFIVNDSILNSIDRFLIEVYMGIYKYSFLWDNIWKYIQAFDNVLSKHKLQGGTSLERNTSIV